jgi:ABC-2 type transport system permease protein
VFPSQLAADGAIALAGGRAGGWAVPVLGLAAMAGTLFVISIVLAERMYLTGWSRVSPGTGKARRRRGGIGVAGIFRWLPSVERSIVTATVRLFLRSPQQIQPVATLTVMMAVLPFVMGRSSSGPLMSPGLILRSLTVLTFIGALHLSTSSTGIDGRSFWILLTAPCSAIRKLGSKLLVSVIVFTALAVVIVFGATGLVAWSMLPKLIWLAICMSSAGGSVGILLGIHFTNWEWEIPKRMLTMTGRFIMLAVMALFFIGVAITISGSGSVSSAPLAGTAGWTVLALVGGVTAAATAGLLTVSARKLERMEWPI